MILSKEELEQKIEPAIPLLKEYWALLLQWQKSVNLISDKTIKRGGLGTYWILLNYIFYFQINKIS